MPSILKNSTEMNQTQPMIAVKEAGKIDEKTKIEEATLLDQPIVPDEQEPSTSGGIKRKREDEDEDEDEVKDFPKNRKLDDSPGSATDGVSQRREEEEESSTDAAQLPALYVPPTRFTGVAQIQHIVIYFPSMRVGDRVYVHPNLQQGDEPTDEQVDHGMSTWRVVGNIICSLNMSTWLLTLSSRIQFPNARNCPYDTVVVVNRLLKMWDYGRFRGIRERSNLENAVSLVVLIRLSGGHIDNAALMRDPAKYLSAILFLAGPLCVNDTKTFDTVVRVMNEADLVVIRPENLVP